MANETKTGYEREERIKPEDVALGDRVVTYRGRGVVTNVEGKFYDKTHGRYSIYTLSLTLDSGESLDLHHGPGASIGRLTPWTLEEVEEA